MLALKTLSDIWLPCGNISNCLNVPCSVSHIARTRRVLSRSRCCPRNGDEKQPQDRPKGAGDRSPKENEEECEEDEVHKGPYVDEDVEESAGLVICQSMATKNVGGTLTYKVDAEYLPCALCRIYGCQAPCDGDEADQAQDASDDDRA